MHSHLQQQMPRPSYIDDKFVLCRIPAGGTAKVEFFVTPLNIGSGVASPALVTYKRQEGASETQVNAAFVWSSWSSNHELKMARCACCCRAVSLSNHELKMARRACCCRAVSLIPITRATLCSNDCLKDAVCSVWLILCSSTSTGVVLPAFLAAEGHLLQIQSLMRS